MAFQKRTVYGDGLLSISLNSLVSPSLLSRGNHEIFLRRIPTAAFVLTFFLIEARKLFSDTLVTNFFRPNDHCWQFYVCTDGFCPNQERQRLY